MPGQPVDFLAEFDAKRRNDAKAMTTIQLFNELSRLNAIIDRADDSSYGGLATGDCAADDREFIYAEMRNRGFQTP